MQRREEPLREKSFGNGMSLKMAKEDVKVSGKWNPGAWTPIRCAVWKKLAGDAQKAFESWVYAESHQGECYSAQILPDHEAILAAG